MELTPLQYKATSLHCNMMYVLLVGGRRSGKTFINFRNIVLRANGSPKPSKHLIFRYRFNHVKNSIWYETMPKVFDICFPDWIEGVHYHLNKTDWFVRFNNGSTIWLGGLDDKDRTEKILGTEYSTVYYNESSQIDFHGFETGLSGLAENSGIDLCAWLDENPPSKKHWTYKMFVEFKHPLSNKPLNQLEYGSLLMNPDDNRKNLPASYFDILDNLSKRKRDRYRDGLFLTDLEGALWDTDMIAKTVCSNKDAQEFKRIQTVVAVDPTVSNQTDTNDECGIVIISKDTKKRTSEGSVLVESDKSGHYTTKAWPKKVVDAYHRHAADYIIAEKNQGGELVKDVIQQIDPLIKVILVHASKGKYARAEPTTVLYERRKVMHSPGLEHLEEQLLDYVPHQVSYSPGALDALVWGLTYLFMKSIRSGSKIRIRTL